MLFGLLDQDRWVYIVSMTFVELMYMHFNNVYWYHEEKSLWICSLIYLLLYLLLSIISNTTCHQLSLLAFSSISLLNKLMRQCILASLLMYPPFLFVHIFLLLLCSFSLTCTSSDQLHITSTCHPHPSSLPTPLNKLAEWCTSICETLYGAGRTWEWNMRRTDEGDWSPASKPFCCTNGQNVSRSIPTQKIFLFTAVLCASTPNGFFTPFLHCTGGQVCSQIYWSRENRMIYLGVLLEGKGKEKWSQDLLITLVLPIPCSFTHSDCGLATPGN